jgi:hypothetical protein
MTKENKAYTQDLEQVFNKVAILNYLISNHIIYFENLVMMEKLCLILLSFLLIKYSRHFVNRYI